MTSDDWDDDWMFGPDERTLQEKLNDGLYLWITVGAAMLQQQGHLRVRMTSLARFDGVHRIVRDPGIYDLVDLQPFVLEIYEQFSEKPWFALGPGAHYAFAKGDMWEASEIGAILEGGPSDIAESLLRRAGFTFR